jgi:hypothetical protein
VVRSAAERRHGGGPGRHLGGGSREVPGGRRVAIGRRLTRRFCEPREVGGSPADPPAQCGDLQQNRRDRLVAARGAVALRSASAFHRARIPISSVRMPGSTLLGEPIARPSMSCHRRTPRA